MIQLTNLLRHCRRSAKGLQTGFDQDIYRVLAIAQTVKSRLYTAADVIRLDWNMLPETFSSPLSGEAPVPRESSG